jgi:hypothetical protein
MAITAQEAWIERGGCPLTVPAFVREVVEEIAFQARQDQKIDKRSGVSQRLPISLLENVVSSANAASPPSRHRPRTPTSTRRSRPLRASSSSARVSSWR